MALKVGSKAPELKLTDEAGNPFKLSALKGKTVVLDPGHGGDDPGAFAVGGAPEKEFTLRLAREAGMRTMLEDGLRKAAAGVTTIEELLRVVLKLWLLLLLSSHFVTSFIHKSTNYACSW